MKMRTIITAFAIAAISGMPAAGQQADAQSYSLQQCIDIGLKHNIEILRSRTDIERSRAGKTEALGAFLPGVRASGQWTRYDRDQIGFRGDNFYVTRNSYNYSVQAGLTLFDGMRNFNTVDQSLLNFEASELGYMRSRESIIYHVQQGYFNVLRFEQLMKVSESNLARSRGQLERIEEMNAVGSVPKADVFRQQVTVGNDELAVLESRNNFRNALVDFQALLGVNPRPDFQLEKSDIPASITDEDVAGYRVSIGEFTDMVNLALQSRTDYRQSELGVQSAEKSVSIASSGHWPTVSAFAQYSWNNLELADFDVYDRFYYGVSLNVPIFSNFQVSSNVQRSEMYLRDSEYAHEQLHRSIATEIMKALNNLEMAEKNVDISRKKLLSAREDQRIAQERYQLGGGTLLDQITANANLTLAEADVVNARFNYLTAQKQMDYQLGRNQ